MSPLWIWAHLSGAALAAEGRELQIWNEVGVELDLPKRWELQLSESLRLDPLAPPAAEELLTDLSLGWRPTKKAPLELSAGFRQELLGVGSGELGVAQRINVDLGWEIDPGPFELDMRLRGQQRPPWSEAEEWADRNPTLRLKGGLDLKQDWAVEPVLAVEPWWRAGQGLHKVRVDVGAKGDLGDWGLKVLYRYEEPLSDPTDPRRHVVALSVERGVELD